MIEIILSISFALGFIGLLVFMYFEKKAEREYIKKIQTDLTNLPNEMQQFYMQISADNTKQTSKVLGESFKNFLKHIEKLERMTLPKPVTTKDVQSVMSRIGPMADETLEIENDIENAEKGVEMPNNEWTGFITQKTKVAFDEDVPVVEA